MSTTTHPDVPSAPFNLTARAVGTSRIDLSWSAPRNTGGAPILGYRIEASDDGGGTWRIIRRNTNSTTTSFSDLTSNPRPRGTTASAINTAGTGPASNVEARDHRRDPSGRAPKPRRGGGRHLGDRPLLAGAHRRWRRQCHRLPDRGSDNGGATWQDLVANTRSTRTTYSHTGLEPATTRHYRVSAINRIGVGRASSIASATTDATVPDAPTGLVATATTSTQIDLAWVAPAYDGGAPITGYRIEVSETGAAWTDLQPNTGTASPTFSHPGLLPGSTRFYRVSAINRAGTGAPSGVASAATDDPVERAGRLNTRVLPHVAAAMTSSTVSAIARRVDAMANGMGMERRVEANGLSSMAASLSSPGGVGLGRQDRSGLSSLFGGASFQMPLGATDAPQATSTGTRMGSWGAGEYHYLGEPGSSVLDWSGNMVSAHVGVDGRLASDMLAGLAASYSSGSFDFTDRTGASPVTGTYATTMTSVNPYLAWFSGDRGNAVWGSAGYGWGDIEVDDEREALRTSPVRSFSGAAGGSYQLLESGIGGVRVKAEGWAGQVMVDGGERVDSVTLAMQRGKLALEWTQGFRSAAGHEVAIVLEGGMRYDNGDGVNGTSGEVGGGLRYTNAGVGVTAEGRGRLLVSAREGYEEWGLGGMILFDPAARGQGLQVRLAPSYGDAASGVNQLWERGVSGAVRDHDMGRAANLDGEVAYGVAGFQGTPYSGFYLAENGVRAFSSGVRYDLGSGLGLRLEGTRRESGFGARSTAWGSGAGCASGRRGGGVVHGVHSGPLIRPGLVRNHRVASASYSRGFAPAVFGVPAAPPLLRSQRSSGNPEVRACFPATTPSPRGPLPSLRGFLVLRRKPLLHGAVTSSGGRRRTRNFTWDCRPHPLIRSDLRRRLQSFRPSRPRFAFQRPAPRSPRASGTGSPRFRRASPYHQFAAVPLRLVFELAQQLAACAFDFDLSGIMHDAGRGLVLQIFLVVSDLARLVTQAGEGALAAFRLEFTSRQLSLQPRQAASRVP